MPGDNRRLQIPDYSVGFNQYLKESTKSYKDRLINILGENNIRKDGRGCEDQRKIFMKTGVVTQAKGSAYVELNKTKVLVSVFDPREIPRLNEFSHNGELYCEFKFAPFSCTERQGHIMNLEEKDLSVILRRSLEPAVCRHEFPNFQVDIYALLLDNDGSCLSAAITAAGLALADAGIPMYDIVTSASLVIQGDSFIVDPTSEEEEFCKNLNADNALERGLVSLSYMPNLAQITELTMTGNVQVNKVLKSMDILISKCNKIAEVTQVCLMETVFEHLS